MDQEELAQMLKLSDGKVAGHHRLQGQWGEDTFTIRHVHRDDAALQPDHQRAPTGPICCLNQHKTEQPQTETHEHRAVVSLPAWPQETTALLGHHW